MKTVIVNDKAVQRNWLLIDAEELVLGRVATKVAHLLKGKHKVTYSDSVDVGDFVVVINADKLKLTGKKAFTKTYFSHRSTRPGAWTAESYANVLAKDPRRPLEHAVKGMLPKNSLGRRMFRKLFVYGGSQHPHAAQQPAQVKF